MMTVLFNGEVIEFEIKETLSVFEKTKFVELVTGIVSPNEKKLLLTMKDFAFNVTLVSMFTNIFDDEEFDDEMRILDFVENTNIVKQIKNTIGNELLTELDKSVCYAVKARTGVNINGFEYELGNVVNSIIKGISDLKSIGNEGEFKDFLEKFSKEDLDAKRIVEEYFKNKEVVKKFE